MHICDKYRSAQACLWFTIFFSHAAYSSHWIISEPTSITSTNLLKKESLISRNYLPQKNIDQKKTLFTLTTNNKVNQTGINTGDINDPFELFEDADDYYAFIDELKNITGWVKLKYDKGDHNQIESAKGFSTETHGFSIGANSELSLKTKIGVAFTYDKTKNEGSDKEKLLLSSMLSSFYTLWSDRKYFFDTEFSLGFSNANRDRSISNMLYKNKFDINTVSVSITSGKHFKHRGWNIDPNIVLNYALASFNNYTETSTAGKKSNVTLKDIKTIEIGSGIKIGRSYWGRTLVRRGHYKPELSLTAYYDARQDISTISARIPISRDGFIITGPKKDRFRLEGKMGLTLTRYKRFTFNVSYRFNKSANYFAHGASADFRYPF
ncbi:MAG: autotransporter outer membrane beta-barrel domain-containing protein [Endozoicomonas sp. (ex Botrylloides leachii)]|nr:autotransporter outer membrane beta-barrel domain-containing protein [Endozoicomonas sp. (ex Botrylloides leachii)]